MKSNWQTKKLAEICNLFADGDWIEKKDQSAEGIRLIQTGNIGNGTFKDRAEKARYISEETFKRLRCTEILPNDCLISRLPDPVGRSCILPETGEKMITAVDCTIIRFNKEVVLSQWFVYYSLSHEYQDQINKQISGATRQRISRSNLGLIEIPLPSIAEQKRLVKFLDKVFGKTTKAQENTENNLQNSQELFESYLENVFSKSSRNWKQMKLKDVGQTQTGLTPTTSNRKYYGNFIPFIKPADVDIGGNGTIQYENKGLSDGGLVVGRKIKKNSVLMVCIGASIGKVGFSDVDVSCNQQINTLTPKPDNDPKFFYYALKTKDFYKRVIKNSSQATLPIINKSKWESLSVIFPGSLTEQKIVRERLDALTVETKKLENNYKRKLSDLREFRKSILRMAFTNSL